MIDQVNRVLRAATKILVLEAGVRQVLGEVQDGLRNSQYGGMILLASHPGCGSSTVLQQVAHGSKRSTIRVKADIFHHSASLIERVADCFGVMSHDENYKRIPRYLIEMINFSGRINIVIDDVDMMWQSSQEIETLSMEINALVTCSRANIVCSTKSLKFVQAVLKWVSPAPCIMTMPKVVSSCAANRFIHEYSYALSLKLGVQASTPPLLTDNAMSVADLANSVRTEKTISMLQASLGLGPNTENCNVFRRYLEIASIL